MAQRQVASPTQAPLQIKDLRPSVITNINLTFIVLENGPLSRIDEAGPLVSVALVADATAAVHLQLWGNECDAFLPGDIVCLTNGVFSFHKTNLVLRAGKKGQLEKTGEFTMVFSENVNMSKLQWAPDQQNLKVWNPVGFNPNAPPRQPVSLWGTYGQFSWRFSLEQLYTLSSDPLRTFFSLTLL